MHRTPPGALSPQSPEVSELLPPSPPGVQQLPLVVDVRPPPPSQQSVPVSHGAGCCCRHHRSDGPATPDGQSGGPTREEQQHGSPRATLRSKALEANKPVWGFLSQLLWKQQETENAASPRKAFAGKALVVCQVVLVMLTGMQLYALLQGWETRLLYTILPLMNIVAIVMARSLLRASRPGDGFLLCICSCSQVSPPVMTAIRRDKIIIGTVAFVAFVGWTVFTALSVSIWHEQDPRLHADVDTWGGKGGSPFALCVYAVESCAFVIITLAVLLYLCALHSAQTTSAFVLVASTFPLVVCAILVRLSDVLLHAWVRGWWQISYWPRAERAGAPQSWSSGWWRRPTWIWRATHWELRSGRRFVVLGSRPWAHCSLSLPCVFCGHRLGPRLRLWWRRPWIHCPKPWVCPLRSRSVFSWPTRRLRPLRS
eukprot:COSAG01_NODE_610_length_14860_cov_222.563647_3_plen_426_part_00